MRVRVFYREYNDKPDLSVNVIREPVGEEDSSCSDDGTQEKRRTMPLSGPCI